MDETLRNNMDHDISQMKKNKLLLPLTLSSKQEASNG
jgi:hypothetical protein